jgi:exodeoxyribonuclease-5
MTGGNMAKGSRLRVAATSPSGDFSRAGGSKENSDSKHTADGALRQGAAASVTQISHWSPDQDRALVAIEKWRRAGDELLFKLHGYAGTGKSTLIVELARNTPGAVVLTPTNKAAATLTAMGGVRACTIHSYAYSFEGCEADRLRGRIEVLALAPAENRERLEELQERLEALIDDAARRGLRPTGDLYFDEGGDEDEQRPRMLIIDEASMVADEQAARIMSFGIPVLAIGDPMQLPPPKDGAAAPFVTGEPDAMLSHIHRQAEGSPIIRLSQAIREGRLTGFRSESNEAGAVRIIRGYIPDEALSASSVDQIVVGRHVLRRALNARVRRLRGFTGDAPQRGERLLSKTNSSSDHRELCNGDILIVEDPGVVTRDEDGDLRWDGDVRHEGRNDLFEVAADLKMLRASADDAPGASEAVATHPPPGCDDVHYGYAVTCHAAQGSQWSRVLVKDESFCFRQHSTRWLYTAVTRAQRELTLVEAPGWGGRLR